MALIGVFVSFTLGIGIIWLGIPLRSSDLCVRAQMKVGTRLILGSDAHCSFCSDARVEK